MEASVVERFYLENVISIECAHTIWPLYLIGINRIFYQLPELRFMIITSNMLNKLACDGNDSAKQLPLYSDFK